jgi:hypothetical protein
VSVRLAIIELERLQAIEDRLYDVAKHSRIRWRRRFALRMLGLIK